MENAVDKPRYWTISLAVLSFLTPILTLIFYFVSTRGFSDDFPVLVVSIGLVAIVFGVIAIALTPNRKRALGLVTLAVLGIILNCLLIAFLITNTSNYRQGNESSRCMMNVRQLGIAMLLYAGDHSDRLPPPDKWNDAIKVNYIKHGGILLCPSEKDNDLPCYAMNAQLKGLRLKDVADPASTVLVFESRPGRNLYGGPELFPRKPRHRDYYIIAFADGRVNALTKDYIKKLNWNPKKKPAKENSKP